MLRRLTILAALVAYAGTALTAPAHATADHVICVGNPTGACDEHQATIQLALNVAGNNGLVNTVLVGPGTYSNNTYDLDGTAHHLTVRGSGAGVTTLTVPANPAVQTYVVAHDSSVADLTINLVASGSSGDTGLYLQNSSADHVAVTAAPGTVNVDGIVAQDGSTVGHSRVDLPYGGESTGIAGFGGVIVADTSISADNGFVHSASGADALTRVSIRSDYRGIQSDTGPVAVDDTVIDMGTSASTRAISVENPNNSSALKSVNANHVTIVGGGAGSYGVYVWAGRPTTLQQASAILTNSIVRGPETDLYAYATNDGSQGGTSVATITTSYSDWHTAAHLAPPHGTATITVGAGHLDVAPGFRDAAHGNYRLTTLSPLVDAGTPGTGGPTGDRDGRTRVLDGDRDGTAVRDLGAYETLPDYTAPQTRFTHVPGKRVTRRRVGFAFASSEPASTFRCRLDAKPWHSCTSPQRFGVTKGWHTFRVRARDAFGNTDATPATYRFRRVR